MKKLFKKSLAVILVVVITLTAAPLSGFAGLELPSLETTFLAEAKSEVDCETETYTGICGESAIWTLHKDTGLLEISGTGAMYDYYDCFAAFQGTYTGNMIPEYMQYSDIIKSVSISDGITYIGAFSFFSLSSVQEVTFADTITGIGDFAFWCCIGLISVTFPDSLKTIGMYSFYYTSLAGLSIPNAVESIGICAFANCYNMTDKIILSASVNYIGEGAFAGTGSGINVEQNNSYYTSDENGVLFDKAKTQLLYYPFNGTATIYEIPSTVKQIGVLSFGAARNLKSVTIPEGVIEICDEAFSSCVYLESITIPDSVQKIGANAFLECDNLTDINIGSGVKSIGKYAFVNTGYTLNTNNRDKYGFCYIDNWLIGQFGSVNENDKYCIIKEGTVGVADYLYGDPGVELDLYIPDSVVYIGGDAFANLNIGTIEVDANNKEFFVDELGVLFNTDKTRLIKCSDSNSIGSLKIPSTIATIEGGAFWDCEYLTDICLPDSIKHIGYMAFARTSIKEIDIPDSVVDLGSFTFFDCADLESVSIGDNVEYLREDTFCGCKNLKNVSIGKKLRGKILVEISSLILSEDAPWSYGKISAATFDSAAIESIEVDWDNQYYSNDSYGVLFDKNKETLIRYTSGSDRTQYIIPESVTAIGAYAFACCENLENVHIPVSVSFIGDTSFIDSSLTYICSTTEVCYARTYAVENEIEFRVCTGHSNSSQPPEDNYGINIPEDIVFIDKDEHYLFSAYDINGNDITEKANWSSTTSVDCTGEVKITNNGDVQGVKEGLTNVHATYYELDNLDSLCSDSCYVFVGDPNEAKYTSVSDTVYYYGENAFYSDAGQFSDSVDIYILMENDLHEQIKFLTEYDKYADELSTLDMGEFTIYASVDGTNLSFDKNEYINNYIVNHRNIPISKAVDELLTLYPYNLDVSSGDKTFTVNIRIESEDFDTITDSFTFKISSLEEKEINEHISFIDSNGMYEAMRDNDFATNMSELKNDSQYIWSKYSTLDFENYHEVLMADILVKLMETQLVGNISLLPVLKEWNSNYNTILSSVSTIVEDSYAGSMEITDNLIDKVIKKSKYATEGMDVHDEVRDLVVLKLRDKVSIDKINSAFAALDKTGQCLDLFDMGVNITNDIADWVDCVSIMNSYQNMNKEFKNVIQKVYDCIPNDDWKVKEAVNHYVKLDTTAGYTQEVIESVIELSKDITLEVFNSVFKKQFVSMFTKAVGDITLKSGALLSSTSAFSAISTGLGAISTGATLGLCISDILCNNSGQAAEMGRVVAASQLAPYVIQTLKYYEWALKNYKDESSLKHFEVAFNLNKALQIYSIEHTYKGLEIQANSIVIKLFSRRDYPGAMAELASLKTSHINCNCCEDVYTGVIKTKTIAIKCPVDVYIYDENGKEVVRIINDVVVSVEDGINVFINGREKYVTVPANQEYSVKIVATDEGTMDYLVIEHDETGQYDRIVKSLNIDLNKNQTFTGKVCEEFDVNKDSYALNTNGAVIKPNSSANVSTEIADKIPVLSIYEASKTGNTLTVNIDLTKNEFNSLDLIFVLNGLKCKKIEAGNSLKALEVEQYSLNPNAIGTQANLSCSTNNGIKPGTVVKITFEIVEDEYRFTAKSLACGIVVNGKIIETEPIINDIVSGAIHKHFYTTKVTQPTCTEQGFTTYSCSCGDSYISDYTSETGHADGKWQIFMVSSEDGIILENSTCPVCGSSLGLNFIEDFISINKIEMNYMNSSTLTTSINSAPGNGYTISYSSSNPTIAAVDANGKITAKGIGSATITITVTDELGNTTTDTCDVNVQYTWWQWIIVIILFGWLWY